MIKLKIENKNNEEHFIVLELEDTIKLVEFMRLVVNKDEHNYYIAEE